MTRTSLADVACSIARASDLFADAWTALIMRDVLTGVTRFDDLARDLGISRKVLAARLSRLVAEDVLTRERYQDHPPREHYVATEKGEELYPVLLALMRWGDRWYGQESGPPVRIHHLECGHDTEPVTVCGHCGHALTVDTTTQLPGPGGRVGPGTQVIGPLVAARRPPEQPPTVPKR
ncbi:putative DNA-binding protein [Streptomyces lincolnensis]|uniref:Putative DNA-binding protein n=1 Tax=Streptomyces lincolnensis TaxID=1915 RepID=A0A1B1M3W3_STRLN|nr:helix-turn-helix domain-containing protein [Streptomyces lincolnensis]ANS63335.1 putative DNA-binding protein [Streptomyces lincolnensis]AXG52257.1 putative DNA-binding protein [Streptomyces lincolnensis]QMV05232.1 transcriptional regulator [Streptomyces lincolnensis]